MQVRLTAENAELLMEAAKENGRSITREANRILEKELKGFVRMDSVLVEPGWSKAVQKTISRRLDASRKAAQARWAKHKKK